MNNKKSGQLIVGAAILATAVLAPRTAMASTIGTETFTGTSTIALSGIGNLAFPAFQPALGTLLEADLSYTLTFTPLVDLGLGNLPDGGTYSNVSSSVTEHFDLLDQRVDVTAIAGPFSGTIAPGDYRGDSFTFDNLLGQTVLTSGELQFTSEAELAALTPTYDPSPLFFIQNSQVSGETSSSQIVLGFGGGNARLDASLTYIYSVPEPASCGVIAFGIPALLPLRRRPQGRSR